MPLLLPEVPPEEGELRWLREEPDDEDPPLLPPPPLPPAPTPAVTATAPVGVWGAGAAGLGLERLEAALPTPAGEAPLAGDGRVLNNWPMAVVSHCSRASSMRGWSPLSRISWRMLGETMARGEPRLEADAPTPAGLTGVEGCEGRRDPSASAMLVVPKSKSNH